MNEDISVLDLHDIARIDGERPSLAAHKTHLLTSDVTIVRYLAVHKSYVLKGFKQLKAAEAIVRPTTGVIPRDQQPFPSNLRTEVGNKFGFDAVAAEQR
jgi:hypothetical protein